MGQQQILLIILGAIVVGIAILIGVMLFQDNASAANRDAVINDMTHFASMAQAYYRKPRVLGGGGHSFGGLKMSNLTSANLSPRSPNGTYVLTPDPVGGNPSYVTLTGTGVEVGNDPTQPVKVVMRVYADSVKVDLSLGN